MSRLTKGELAFDIDDLDVISAEVGLPIFELMQMPEVRFRGGASVRSIITDIATGGRVGPTGLEPMTSTVEDGRFGPDWMAPVVGITSKVIGL